MVVHYKRNYKKLYISPKLNMLLSRAANAYCEVNFHKFMESLKKESPTTYAWLQDEPTENRCKYKFDPSTKVLDNSAKSVESFNNVIHACRDKLIFSVFEELREKFTEWIIQRHVQPSKWTGRIAPTIKDKLAKFESEAWSLMLRCCGQNLWEVHDGWTRFIVDLNAKTWDYNYQ